MSRYGMILSQIRQSAFRSWVIFICSALLAGFLISAWIILGGAQKSLNLVLDRLGADMMVIPAGTESLLENAFLMGAPARAWMPAEVIGQIQTIDGVQAVSPQFFLSTLRGANCCSVPDMFLIAYDPGSDFTLRPWLESHFENGLQAGQAVGGSFVYLPSGQEKISIYGYDVELAGKLEPTGTGLDQSLFFTFDTAYEIARQSYANAEQPLDIPTNSVSAAMLKLERGANRGQIAQVIEKLVPGVSAVESSYLFHNHQAQIQALFRSYGLLLGMTWILSVGMMSLATVLSVKQRQREMGVLRALGASQGDLFQSLLLEGVLIAFGGAAVGTAFFTLTVYLFRGLLIKLLGMPFLFPSIIQLLGIMMGVFLFSLISVALAAFVPVFQISRVEPALAMRK